MIPAIARPITRETAIARFGEMEKIGLDFHPEDPIDSDA